MRNRADALHRQFQRGVSWLGRRSSMRLLTQSCENAKSQSIHRSNPLLTANKPRNTVAKQHHDTRRVPLCWILVPVLFAPDGRDHFVANRRIVCLGRSELPLVLPLLFFTKRAARSFLQFLFGASLWWHTRQTSSWHSNPQVG